jgi:hypothetical protein
MRESIAFPKTVLSRTSDFALSGDGRATAWKKARWLTLSPVGKVRRNYPTRVKVIWSATGMYFLFECADRRLTCTMTEDNDDIFREDVFELFLWTDMSQRTYFEYEVSPLNVELPLFISNNSGPFMGWLPWKYRGERKIRKATSVQGGEQLSMARISGWKAEVFIPFALFTGLGNSPPKKGTEWRANLYRIDYDGGRAAQWAWCTATGPAFHNFRKFGTFVFG